MRTNGLCPDTTNHQGQDIGSTTKRQHATRNPPTPLVIRHGRKTSSQPEQTGAWTRCLGFGVEDTEYLCLSFSAPETWISGFCNCSHSVSARRVLRHPPHVIGLFVPIATVCTIAVPTPARQSRIQISAPTAIAARRHWVKPETASARLCGRMGGDRRIDFSTATAAFDILSQSGPDPDSRSPFPFPFAFPLSFPPSHLPSLLPLIIIATHTITIPPSPSPPPSPYPPPPPLPLPSSSSSSISIQLG